MGIKIWEANTSLTLLLSGKGRGEREPSMQQLIIVRCIACKTCKRDVLHEFCPSVCLSVRHIICQRVSKLNGFMTMLLMTLSIRLRLQHSTITDADVDVTHRRHQPS